MKKYTIVLLFLVALCTSCSEIIQEKDISGQTVPLVAPVNNAAFSSTGVTFTWEKLEGASAYQLQIASPDFTNALRIVADTIVAGSSFTQQLPVGSYEWKVRALNGSSNTNYSNRFIAVVSNDDFQSNTVTLTSPANNLITNVASQNLTWQAVIGAVNYQLQVYDNANTIVLDQTVTATGYNYIFPQGTLQWRVRASNGTQQTLFSSRSIVTDTTVPNTPALINPANAGTVTSGNVSFQWSRTPVAGSVERDIIYIYTNSQLTILHSETQTTSPYAATLPSGTYYWKVQSFDAAGNVGTASPVFNFTVN
ncbi:MAG TPA: hypothetical protein VF677_14860 [Flavobacterium sp.]|jgi:hypothetical protein